MAASDKGTGNVTGIHTATWRQTVKVLQKRLATVIRSDVNHLVIIFYYFHPFVFFLSVDGYLLCKNSGMKKSKQYPWYKYYNYLLLITAVGSNPTRAFRFFMRGDYPASLRNVGGSIHRCQLGSEIINNSRRSTWGRPPPVRLESHHITFTVLLRRKPEPKRFSH